MAVHRVNIDASKSVNVPFAARSVLISNPTGRWVYVSVGSTISPSIAADIVVAPFTYIQQPISPSSQFAFTLGDTFLPTPSAQGAVAQATFFDADQSAIVANINTPGASYQANYVFANPVLASAASVVLIPGISGKKIYILYIKATSDPTIGGTTSLSFWHSNDPDIVWLNPATLTGTGTARMVDDVLDAKPHGFPLTSGASLKMTNYSGSTRQPSIFILYNYA